MQKKNLTKDSNWEERIEQTGFIFHTNSDGSPYWVDDYYFSITEKEADNIFAATEEIWEMCKNALTYIILEDKLDEFHIPKSFQSYLKESWLKETPTIYGRFDFAFDQYKHLKLLEFNADTPTTLFECGIVQWYWMQHHFDNSKEQFNTIHEKLIENWENIQPNFVGKTLHFSCVQNSIEDLTTIEYLRDCATQAGIETELIYMDEIGWNGVNFVNLREETITDIFKLYPWEWLLNENFAENIVKSETIWMEPAWKMILSNKLFLAYLWEINPNHPLLLECYKDTPKSMKDYVKKPIFSRQGKNVEIFKNGDLIEKTIGEISHEEYVYQELAFPHQEDSGYTILGSWIIGQESCGITFRESDQLITTDKSRFVPHIIE